MPDLAAQQALEADGRATAGSARGRSLSAALTIIHF
jgi:hypothetical protein